MKRYRVTLEGRNFLVDLYGARQKMGFYVTRNVDARDPASAESLAMSLVMEELRPLILNDPEDRPRVSLESIREVDASSCYRRKGSGFGWFYEEG